MPHQKSADIRLLPPEKPSGPVDPAENMGPWNLCPELQNELTQVPRLNLKLHSYQHEYGLSIITVD